MIELRIIDLNPLYRSNCSLCRSLPAQVLPPAPKACQKESHSNNLLDELNGII